MMYYLNFKNFHTIFELYKTVQLWSNFEDLGRKFRLLYQVFKERIIWKEITI